MSKMSWLHAELSERASELGFESLEDAERNGYEISMDGMTPTLKPNASKQLELAHADWLKEKQQVLDELTDVINDGELDWGEIVRKVEHALEFIEERCHD